MFTRQQIEEIRDKLLLYSKKDSQLESALSPITGKEEVVLVQNGKNVKITISDLINNIFPFKSLDFINISNAIEHKFTLEEAISAILPPNRKSGLVITFMNRETDEWEIYQYTGEYTRDWFNLELWSKLFDATSKFKGYILNRCLLYSIYPSPKIGDYAFVGESLGNALVARCINNGVWSITTETAKDYVKIIIDGNITVGANGNWFQNGVDTGIKAQGPKGEQGIQGIQGIQGPEGQSAAAVKKTYASIVAMKADMSPTDGNGEPLNVGDAVSIYNSSDETDVDNNKLFAWQGTGSADTNWILIGKINQVDIELDETSVNPVENKVIYQQTLYEEIKQNISWIDNKAYGNDLELINSENFQCAVINIENIDILKLDIYLNTDSSAYLSITDKNNSILYQTNNINSIIKYNIKNEYPSATKLYISNKKSHTANIYFITTIKNKVKYLDSLINNIKESINDIVKKEFTIIWQDGKFYKEDLSISGSTSYQNCLINIPIGIKKIDIDINLPHSGAYLLLTNNNNDILFKTNIINNIYTINLIDYPEGNKLYVSNNKDNKPNPKIYYYEEISDNINNINTNVEHNSITIFDGLHTRFFDIFYNSTKKIDFPSEFLPFPININICKESNIYGCDINPYFMKKNNIGKFTYYIHPNGSDTNNGLTPTEPFKTLEKALSNIECNTIILLEGEYKIGINFQENIIIDKEINIIGLGNVIINSINKNPIQLSRGCYIENIIFNGGKSALKTELKEDLCIFIQCKFNNSIQSNGLSALGGHYILYKCSADNNMLDGFNYHSYTDEINQKYYPFVIEINCIGKYNGINSDSDINNCSTMHEYGKIIRLNCQYYASKGGVVADADNAKSLNFSIISNSTITNVENRNGNFVAINKAKMWLYDCISFGSEFDIISDDSIIYRNIPFIKEKISNGGTINNII